MLRPGMISRYGGEVAPPPAFDPGTLGLWTWAKAGEESYVDGDPAEATDLSGGGHPLLQATSSKRPTYKTGILDGKAVWRFDGVDDVLGVAGTLVIPVQVVIVCKFRVGHSGFVRIMDSKTPVYNGSFFRNSATEVGLYASGSADPMIATAPESWQCYEYVFNAASSRLTDGTTSDTGNPGTNTSHGGVSLGARGDGIQDFATIDVAEVMVRDSVFDAGELSDIAGYIASEYPSI